MPKWNSTKTELNYSTKRTFRDLSSITYSMLQIIVLVLLSSHVIQATNVTTDAIVSTTTSSSLTTVAATTPPDSGDNALPQIAIVVAVIAVIVLIGIGISKCAEHCYERSSIRDNASDISEDTKAVLKFHLQLMKDKKNKDKADAEASKTEKAAKVLKIWGKTKIKSEDTQQAENDDQQNANTKVPTISSVETGATLLSSEPKLTPKISVNMVNENDAELESIDSKESEKALLQNNTEDETIKVDCKVVSDTPDETEQKPNSSKATIEKNNTKVEENKKSPEVNKQKDSNKQTVSSTATKSITNIKK